MEAAINSRSMGGSGERNRDSLRRRGREWKDSMRERSLRKRNLCWRKDFEKQRALYREIRESGADIFQSPNFYSTKSHIQHGNMTVNDHCVRVAAYSLALSKKLHIPCSHRELIRGALLHDYFLYDWHDKDYISPHRLHGFFHPGKALKNASAEYDLTPREKEIIKKHMWPLTVVPPTCREAWIVTMADKWCSLMETCHLHKGHGKVLEKIKNQRMKESRQ
ncbi:MAG: hypothetical protein NC417_11435 [Candidatus Gastranaerophilales bacterium]|nr:hypothetical protein [Candidatus Gastranaerophilales bacterium]